MHIPIPARRRLLERLDRAAGLTVLHAPSGAGKTTLLRTWTHELSERGRPVLWVSLSPETTHTQQVRDAVSAAVTETGVLELLSGKRVETLRELGDDMPAREALGTLFSVLPGLVLVIDGGQYVTVDPDRLWEELLTVAANHPTARLVLSTRRLHGRRAELLSLDPVVSLIDEQELVLRPEETAATLAEAAVEDPALADQLTRETGGNPRAVMAGLITATEEPSRSLTGWRRVIDAHTATELGRIGLRPFLERIVVSPWTDAELAAQLAGVDTATAARALDLVETHGYGQWDDAPDRAPVFTLGDAVRSALGTGVLPDPDTAKVLVDWLEERDEPGEALVAALRTGLLHRATGLYRRLLVSRPFDFTASFEPALRAVEDQDLLAHPMLALARGLALLASPGTQQAATPFLEPIARRDPRQLSEDTADDELMDLTAQSVVLGVLGRGELSARAALEAVARLDRPAFSARVTPSLLTPLSCQLSQTLMDAGHVVEAQRLIARGTALAEPEMVHYCALYGRAWYGLDGRVVEALDMDARVGHGTDLPGAAAAGVTWGPRTRALEGVGAGVLHLERWEFDEADARVHEEEAARWDHSRTWREWVRLHAALGQGTHDRAVRELSTALESAGPQQPSLGGSALATVVAVAWLAVGQVARANQALQGAAHPGQTASAQLLVEMTCAGPEAALHLATHLREAEGHTVRSRAALETVAAAAALRTGALELASQLLVTAATIHHEHGCRIHLLHLPGSDRQALRQLADSEGSPTVTAFLAGLETSASLTTPSSRVVLSTRERAVLEALATHRSRVDIAQSLHVSENTVKTQLRSIYRKLEVSQRAEAITRALELDLLRPDQARAR